MTEMWVDRVLPFVVGYWPVLIILVVLLVYVLRGVVGATNKKKPATNPAPRRVRKERKWADQLVWMVVGVIVATLTIFTWASSREAPNIEVGSPVQVIWVKNPETVGSQPERRRRSLVCSITYRDNIRFDFTCYNRGDNWEVVKTIFWWNLQVDSYGTWKQEGVEGVGTWYLQQSGPTLLTGWLKNRSGESFNLTMRLAVTG